MKEHIVVGPKTGSGFVIRHLYAAVIVLDDSDEAIPAVMLPPALALVPLIAADDKRLEWLAGVARKHARESGKTVRLVKFAVREDVETFHPDGRRERP